MATLSSRGTADRSGRALGNEVAAGHDAAEDDADRLRLAYRAYQKGLHSSSARLFAEALTNDPKLADSRQTQHAYNAACAAALAGSGRGKHEPSPDDATKAKLRRQALDWLKAELLAWDRLDLPKLPGTKEIVGEALKHWKADTDLAGIRDEKELAKLPAESRSSGNDHAPTRRATNAAVVG